MNNVITDEKTIVSCDDFELNIKRPKELSYRISYPPSQQLKGIVFVTLGFGAEPPYIDNLRTFIAEEFSVVAVDVSYHCFFSRLNNGATLEFDELDLLILQDFIDKYKMDFSGLKEVTTESVMKKLNDEVGRLKTIGHFPSGEKLQQSITLIPKNNEYQNFGMMQTVDHINVLQEIEKMSLNLVDNYQVTVLGSSHGGYIAHLMAKFAPHKIDCVIDNSCYVKPPLNYLLGKETNILRPESILPFEHIQFNCFVQTLWTTNSKATNYFSSDHYRIRDLGDLQHLQSLARHPFEKTKYISYHSIQDIIVPVTDKIDLYQKLEELGFKTQLHIIKDSTQLDGKFIKDLSHAMGMSLKELVKKELPGILESPVKKKYPLDYEICYECDKRKYRFIYENNSLNIEIEMI